ncbi:MAG: undecaprenyl/decaprenyl-phosphate alpha-N-acetylglucosaminyl 1-phosphate transferase [Deltaproteobacteria bacterium]|nr:undecaprenyl/decaprenyl-phosphate alpha-N-acetylglucosaminyl 1-phosphate transferase [Candidatus Zymogenaceae bacterium]
MKQRFIGPFWYPVLAMMLFLALPPLFGSFLDDEKRWLWLVLFSFSCSFILMPPVMWIGHRWGVLDYPGGRRDHEDPTPRLGGAAVAVSFYTALLLNGILTPALVSIIIASFIIIVVGVLEDVFGVKEWIRLLSQTAAFVVVALGGVVLQLFHPTIIGNILNYFITFLWIVGITNAMNFIDGMNGLASGISIIIGVFLAVIAGQTGQVELGLLSIALLGATVGFVPYNFIPGKKARSFLGDGGSSFLGFVLASLAVLGEWADNDPLVSFSTPLIIFGVLIYDMTYTTIARIISGKVKSFREMVAFVGHDHIHHRMNDIIGNKTLAVFFILLLNIILGLGTLALRGAYFHIALIMVIQALFIFLLITVLEIGAKIRYNTVHEPGDHHEKGDAGDGEHDEPEHTDGP